MKPAIFNRLSGIRADTKVFVAGATGVIGRRIVRQLSARGHAVVGAVRDEKGEQVVLSCGGEPRHADLFDAGSLAEAAHGSEVVIRAATAIPTKIRTSAKDWSMNDRIRRDGTRALTEAAGQIGARAFLQEGVVWAVRSPNTSTLDEDAPPGNNPILASSLDAERIAREAGERLGFEAGVLRFGGFYSADAWHTRVMGDSLMRRRPAMIGPGTNVWSLIQADDAAGAVVAAAERPRSGTWHIVDDRPVALKDFLSAMATRLGAPPPRGFPKSLARLALGRDVTGFLSMSFITTSARFRRDFDWSPRFPTYEAGLDNVVSEWRSEGFPPRRG